MAVERPQTPEEGIRRLTMSYEDYLALPDSAGRVEWVEGEAIFYSSPHNEHQRIVLFLSTLLSLFVCLNDLGVIRFAPLEVKLWQGGSSREPDLFFVRKEGMDRFSSHRFSGAPDLIVEVLSPGTVYIDRNQKFREYEQAGVQEYWLIDSRPDQHRADFYRLNESGRYDLFATEVEETVESGVLENLWLRPTWLWQQPTLNPLLALAEIVGQDRLIEVLRHTPPEEGRL